MQQDVVTLIFETEQVIYAEGGALVHCPKPGDLFASAEERQTYAILDEELTALISTTHQLKCCVRINLIIENSDFMYQCWSQLLALKLRGV